MKRPIDRLCGNCEHLRHSTISGQPADLCPIQHRMVNPWAGACKSSTDDVAEAMKKRKKLVQERIFYLQMKEHLSEDEMRILDGFEHELEELEG